MSSIINNSYVWVFLEVEDFDKVYNLSKISKINESYGDKMVEGKPKAAKAKITNNKEYFGK